MVLCQCMHGACEVNNMFWKRKGRLTLVCKTFDVMRRQEERKGDMGGRRLMPLKKKVETRLYL